MIKALGYAAKHSYILRGKLRFIGCEGQTAGRRLAKKRQVGRLAAVRRKRRVELFDAVRHIATGRADVADARLWFAGQLDDEAIDPEKDCLP